MVGPIQLEYLRMNGRARRPIVTDKAEKPLRLTLLICVHIVISCVSLVYIAGYDLPGFYPPAPFHIFFVPAQWYVAAGVVAAFALVSSFFIFAGFSLGYFAGFYLYTMILGYLWLNCFTDLSYDHRSAGLSAAASAVAFLLPALFFSAPVRQRYVLTARSFDRLLMCLLRQTQRPADRKLFGHDGFERLVAVRVCRLCGNQGVLARRHRSGCFAVVLSDLAEQDRLAYTALACRHAGGFKTF
jgi:hypothetical protein